MKQTLNIIILIGALLGLDSCKKSSSSLWITTSRYHYYTFLFVIVTMLYGCTKNNSNSNNNFNANQFTVSGTVTDTKLNTIAGATVILGSNSVKTDAYGYFVLPASTDSVNHLTVICSGYFTTYKNVVNIDGSGMHTSIMLCPKTLIGSIMASSGGKLYHPNQSLFNITIPANSFVDEKGNNYNGDVNVYAQFSPDSNYDIDFEEPGSNDGGFRYTGMVATSYTDNNGKELTLTKDVTINYVLMGTQYSEFLIAYPAIYDFNTNNSKWDLIQMKPMITNTGINYGMCNFSSKAKYQLIALPTSIGIIKGTVYCANGKPASNIMITMRPNSAEQYKVFTNDNGKFEVKVEPTNNFSSSNPNIPYTISVQGGNSSSVYVTAGAIVNVSGLTTNDCVTGTGKFSANGVNYSGNSTFVPNSYCSSGNDVMIVDYSYYTGPTNNYIIIHNMPSTASGTYNLSNNNICDTHVEMKVNVGISYSTIGTLTKTGTNSFSFNCTTNDSNNGITYSVTGSGNY